MHPLLLRQLNRAQRKLSGGQPNLSELLEVISLSYEDFDRERSLAARASTLMEQELLALNASLEQRVLERTHELNLATEQAICASRSKSDFLAMMSHELRTPLYGILGMIDLCIEQTTSEEVQEMLSMSLSCGKALQSLLNDILDISKLEAQKLELEYVEYNVIQLVSEVVAVFSLQIRQKKIELSVDIDPKIPTKLIGDPSRLRQILFNLLGNAIKFTDYGTVRLNVKLKENEDISWLYFEVIDTGEGIPHDAQGKLFNAFQQADSAIHRRKGGSGLGLAICAQLLELMGGKISFNSTPGKGSTFWFEFKLHEPQPSSIQILKNKSPSIMPDDGVQLNLDILVAEDNLVNQKTVRAILEKAECRVIVVENGEEAVSMLMNQHFDVVLMDINMPVMDGALATQLIRRGSLAIRTIPIIGLSANALKGDREHYLGIGMNDYLTKPLNRRDLIAILKRLSADKSSHVIRNKFLPV